MSDKTQAFSQALADRFNAMMKNPALFSVDASKAKKLENVKNKLINSVTTARKNISNSMKNFKEYYFIYNYNSKIFNHF